MWSLGVFYSCKPRAYLGQLPGTRKWHVLTGEYYSIPHSNLVIVSEEEFDLLVEVLVE